MEGRYGGRRGNEVGPTGREEGGWVEFGRLVRLRVGVEWGGERELRGWWGGKCENGGWRGEFSVCPSSLFRLFLGYQNTRMSRYWGVAGRGELLENTQ